MDKIKEKEISRILIDWYGKNMRKLPWRETSDSYKIWISEVMLQQTRVAQGMEYYMQFLKKFPTVYDLAASSEKDVLKAWQGLGYYSRARYLHEGAKSVVQLYQGKLPKSYKEIKTIKGIGEYTAAAILSIAYNKPHAVVDGNVYRVLSRLFAIDAPIDTAAGKNLFAKLADRLLDKSKPGMHNQAIMEFGALCCTPKLPNCLSCPLQCFCRANHYNMQQEFPVKSRRVKVRDRYFHYFDISYKGKTFLNKREDDDIWKNMYEFPLIETNKEKDLEGLMNTALFKSLFKSSELIVLSVSNTIKHILSHQHIYATFYVVEMVKLEDGFANSFLKINKKDIELYPVSRLINKYLEDKELSKP